MAKRLMIWREISNGRVTQCAVYFQQREITRIVSFRVVIIRTPGVHLVLQQSNITIFSEDSNLQHSNSVYALLATHDK
jgi:hypothetical protein